MKVCGVLLFSVAMLWAQEAPTPAAEMLPSLINRVDESKKSVGILVGVLTPEGRSFASYGGVSKGGARPNAETMFEIGSITKVFTALLLAEMVERGEVAIDDPVAKYLPDTVNVPSRNGRAITLADLTTHTSGLPRVPSNMDSTSLDNPYADYDAAKLYSFLSGYTLPEPRP